MSNSDRADSPNSVRSGRSNNSKASRSSKSKSPSQKTSPHRKLEPKNALNAQNLQRLDLHNLLKGHLEEEPDLDYPCKDKSKGVNDFSEWSYFKRAQFHQHPINMRHSFLWSDQLVEKVNKQNEYMQFTPEPKLTGYKETRANLDRKKRAKKMLAIWKKKAIASDADATDGGALTGRTDSVTVGLSSFSRGRGATRGLGQSESRGRSSSSRGAGMRSSSPKKAAASRGK